MIEKNAPFPRVKTTEQLDEIRDIIFGPQIRELEFKLEKLSRHIAQLAEQRAAAHASYEKRLEQMQADFAAQMKRYLRRAARHRALTTTKIKNLTQQLHTMVSQLEAAQGRAAPYVYKINKNMVADYRYRKQRLKASGKRSTGKQKATLGKAASH